MRDERSDKRPKTPVLTPEDLALWRHVIQGLRPLNGQGSSPLLSVGPETERPAHPQSAKSTSARSHSPGTKELGRANGVSHTPSVSVKKPAKAAPPLSPIDKRTHQRLARGRIEIDGRIDLHGMRQDEARRVLDQYLKTVQAKGGRTVLVITGKGKPEAERPDWWEQRESGVLRRIVPQWLSQPALRSIVQGFDWAANPHGGGGALYVRLRKPGRPRTHKI